MCHPQDVLNYITNYCVGHTRVPWLSTNYELTEEDTMVSKHVVGVENGQQNALSYTSVYFM
jgi:hypothetical protein